MVLTAEERRAAIEAAKVWPKGRGWIGCLKDGRV